MRRSDDPTVTVVWHDPDYVFTLKVPCPRCGSYYGEILEHTQPTAVNPYACRLCLLTETADWKAEPV